MSITNPWPLIQKKFPSSEYALLEEVRDKAGFNASRAADGIAINLWPSRGLHVNGIEVKSYRSDWLSELKKPMKAENIFKFCDYWWLIAAAEGIVKPEEIPKTWGFMEVQKERLKVIIEAPKLTPEPMDRHFVAALLKRATKGLIPASSIEERIKEQVELRLENKCSHQDITVERLEKQLKEQSEMIRDFEDKSGVRINRWDNGRIAEAIKIIMADAGDKDIQQKLEHLKATYSLIITAIEQVQFTDTQNTNNQ